MLAELGYGLVAGACWLRLHVTRVCKPYVGQSLKQANPMLCLLACSLIRLPAIHGSIVLLATVFRHCIARSAQKWKCCKTFCKFTHFETPDVPRETSGRLSGAPQEASKKPPRGSPRKLRMLEGRRSEVNYSTLSVLQMFPQVKCEF